MDETLTNVFGFDITELSVYSGYFKNDDKVFSSSSGGAATALAECIIAKGGVVFGVVYASDFKSAHFACAETVDELEQFKTSKYIATEKKLYVGGEWVSVFEEVAKRLSAEITVLFIGLGCDVGGLLKYLENHHVCTKNLYTVDLICHGPTYAKVQSQYVEALEKKYNSKVVSFSVRYKAKGWTPPFIRAEFANGKVHEERFYESDFGFAFKAYSRSNCYHCQFKGSNHKADLTIGDYWGCTKEMQAYNPLGVSVIFCRSERGSELVDMLSQSEFFYIQSADMNLALSHNRSFYQRRDKNEEEYERFKSDFEKKGLHYAVKNSDGYESHIKRIRRRRIKDMLPTQVVDFVRKIRK